MLTGREAWTMQGKGAYCDHIDATPTSWPWPWPLRRHRRHVQYAQTRKHQSIRPTNQEGTVEENVIVLLADSVEFGSQNDEQSFFEWLKRIKCIENLDGEGSILEIIVAKNLVDDDCLRDILAIFHRYNIDMKQLAIFKSEQNKAWFCSSTKYWFDKVFKD